MKFSKERIISNKVAEIGKLTFENELVMPTWQTKSGVFIGDGQYKDVDAEYSTMSIGDRWNCYDYFTRWFVNTVTVPSEFAGKQLALELEFGGEAIVRVNGKIISALTSHVREEQMKRTRVYLTDKAVAGTVYNIEVEAHSNYMEYCGLIREKGLEYATYTIRKASLVTINKMVESYCFDVATALDGMKTLKNPIEQIVKSSMVLPGDVQELLESLSKDTYYYDKVKDAVLSSISCVDFDFDDADILKSIPKAAQVLKEKMSAINYKSHAVIKFVGQAHIDTAWLWPVKESIRKSAKTLSNVVALMDRYPEFTFAFSQPQLFEFAKDNYPELYEKVKEKVKSGQFELVGNTWVEMDTNIPSGESLVRQLLYGRQYFMEEFGKCSNVFWMPDVFGYTWALPQIIKRSGMKYFFTSKLINNDDNRFPHSLFNWQGVDGTKVTSYLQRLNYNGMVNTKTLDTLYNRFDQKDVVDESLMTFGWGDGGGGPTYEMLETARRLDNFPGLPKLEMDTSENFFDNIADKAPELPTWNDEMYYEFHRGTYTSQANVKKNNRKNEFLYRQSEMANTMAVDFDDKGTQYPYKEFLAGYKKLLTNQFHDIMPGSSIHPVYEDAKEDYAYITKIGNDTFNTALAKLTSNIVHDKNTVIVFNFLSWERTENVRVKLTGTDFENITDISVVENSANAVDSMIISVDGDKYLEFNATNVPQMGYTYFKLMSAQNVLNSYAVVVNENLMENKFYKVTLDNNALITSIYDKRNNREVLKAQSNILKVFEDKPAGESAWNIDIEYQNKEWALTKATSVEVIEASVLKGVLRVTREFNKSKFVQDIVMYQNVDRIDFNNYVDWYETEKMLKAEFNVDVLSSKATYEIQFGAIERPTHYNTSYDKTKFEVCGHKWADLSEGAYGVSLLNDCKYGYDIKDSRMRITLLRAPVSPDPVADKGYHEFTYSLRPHQDTWVNAEVVNAGYNLNAPLTAVLCEDNVSSGLQSTKSYVICDSKNVIIDTIKCAEDKDGIIVRVFESSGTKTNVNLKFNFDFTKVNECDLMEQLEQAMEYNNGLDFVINPFEIKTFKLGR